MLSRRAHVAAGLFVVLFALACGDAAPRPDPDVNDDGVVNVLDMSLVGSCIGLADAGHCPCRKADANLDGLLDMDDLYYVQDALGESGFPVAEPDDDLPRVTLVAPEDGDVFNASLVPVSGYVNEKLFSLAVNGESAAFGTGPAPEFDASVALHGGENTLSVVATDLACNVGTAVVQVVRSASDVVSPSVRLVSPTLVQEAAVLRLTAVASDNVGVAEVSFEVDGLPVSTAYAEPYQLEYTAPSGAAGSELSLRAVARDEAGNEAASVARVRVVAVPDRTAPVIESFQAPDRAAPAETVTVRAEVSDAGGLAEVRFALEGSEVAAASAPPYEARIQIPVDAVPGGLLALAVEAVDLSGNSARAQASIRISGDSDTDPPSGVSVRAPERALAGQRVQVTASAIDAGGVQKVVFLADDVVVNEDLAAPYVFDFTVPAEAAVGARILWSARALDFAGNATQAAPVSMRIDEAGQGAVAGEVYDDGTGLALADARVQLLVGGGVALDPPVEVLSDARGRYRLPAREGDAWIRISSSLYTTVERYVSVTADEVAVSFDARLTRLAEGSDVQAGAGALIASVDPALVVRVGAASFAADASIHLTPLSGQGLPASLPRGWAPLRALHIDADGTPLSPLELIAEQLNRPEELVAAAWDVERRKWLRIPATPTGVEGTGAAPMAAGSLVVEVAKLGTVVVLRADESPFSPALPALGEALEAVAPVALPTDATAAILPRPKVLFLEPGARSQVTVRVDSDAALPSGTAIVVDFDEFYDRVDGSRLLPEPSRQDVRLYQVGTGLEGRLFASPSELFDPAHLREGAISLDAQRPGAGPLHGLLGPAGGVVSAAGSSFLSVPAGSLAGATPVALTWRAPEASQFASNAAFASLAELQVDLGGALFSLPAELSIPAPVDLPLDAQVLVVRVARAFDVTRYELVALAERVGDRLRSNAGAQGLPLPGVVEEGRYLFVRTNDPVAFITGELLADSGPVGSGLVETDSLPFVGFSDALDPSYVVASALGDAGVTGFDLADGGVAVGSLKLASPGAVARLDLTVEPASFEVVAVTPADGSIGAAATSVVTALLSRPVAAPTLDAQSFQLSGAAGVLDGRLSLSADGRTLRFEPRAPLASEQLHVVTLTRDLRDVFGNSLAGDEPDGSFRSSFVTADTTPPPRPEAGQIEVGTLEGGALDVSGSQGTVEPGATVSLENLRYGSLATVIAGADGSFRLGIEAELTDDLELRVVDAAGNETRLPVGRPTPPLGYAVLGDAGGLVEGEGGLGAVLPAGLLPEDTIVSVTPSDITNLELPFSEDFPGFVAGALDIDLGGVEIPNVLELTLEVEGLPSLDVSDRVPLFEIRRQIVIPADTLPGEVLRLRAVGTDEFRQSNALVVELPIVAAAPDATPRTERRPGMPVVSVTLPTQAAPGETIEVHVRADPANIKLRFPADPSLTGDEQILIWEVREVGGEPFWNLVDSASLRTLPDGTRIIETTSPPYRGVRRDTTRLVAAVQLQATLSFIQVLIETSRGSAAGLAGSMIAQTGAFIEMASDIAFGVSLIEQFSQPRPVDVSTFEFAVVPAVGGIPNTVEVIDGRTNALFFSKQVEALPPDTFSGVIVIGEDDNELQVTGTTSLANSAVPLDAGISVSFSHLIETSSISAESLFIRDASGGVVPAQIIFQSRADERVFAALVQPLKPLAAGSSYTLVATEAIRRPGTGDQPGRSLGKPFELSFTTAEPAAVIGRVAIAGANTFDVLGRRAVVARKANGVNGFATVDLSDPANPVLEDVVDLDVGRYGIVRDVAGMANASFPGSRGFQIEGDLMLLTAGDNESFSAMRVYSLDSRPPELLSGTVVGVPTEILLEAAELLVIPTFGSRGGIDDIEVSDPFASSLDGLPKTPAVPWRVEWDGDHTAYFVNQGIGLMTIDLTRAVPAPPESQRGVQFGPSFLPADKTGAVVVRDDPSLVETNEHFSLDSPAHLSFVASPVDVSGAIANPAVTRVLVNGFEAEVTRDADGRAVRWRAAVPLREGPNPVIATAFGSDGTNFGNAQHLLLRDYTRNPLAGPGTVTMSLPPLALVGGAGGGSLPASIDVAVSVSDNVRLDQIYVNGVLASEKQCPFGHLHPERDDCGWSGSGSATVPLGPGIGSVVATAIDVDDDFTSSGASFQDMRVVDGLVVTARAGIVKLFDAAGLVEISAVAVPGGAFRVSVAQGIDVDIDDDGRGGLQENADGDAVTVFSERMNLVLAAGGGTGVLSFVDISEPSRPAVIGSIDLGSPVYRAAMLAGANRALVATAAGIDIVDLGRAHHHRVDDDGDGFDDRILESIPLPGARDVQVDVERGLAYVLQLGEGLAVLSLAACAQDFGIDVSRVPSSQLLRSSTLEEQRAELLKGIQEGLAEPACAPFQVNQGTFLFAQGSSACIWRADGKCSTAYKPGLSDYDFELIVPDGDTYEASLQCADVMDAKIKEQKLLREADVSVFVHPRSTLVQGYRDVRPVDGQCGAGSDRFGDLCLATNGLFLKWLLEGEFVRDGDVQYDDGLSFEGLLEVLRSPVDESSERVDPITGEILPVLVVGAQPEPSHIPRLEGLGWACLQDFALNASGARIRVVGEGLGDVAVQWPFFVKEIHKTAKAGIRSVYGKLLSSEAGNALMLESTRAEYESSRGCLTQVPDPDASNLGVDDFSTKRCESFEEYVASQAIRSVRRDLGLLSEEEALLAYEMFRRKSDVGRQIRGEREANEFIISVMRFIDDVRSDPGVRAAYDTTVDKFTDGADRRANLSRCEGEFLPLFKPELGAEELKLALPTRLFNGGFEPAVSLDVGFYHDGVERKRVSAASLRPGESRFLSKKTFSVAPELSGVHSVSLFVDPDTRYSEYDKSNNFDGLHYYVLYPTSTGQPPTSKGVRPRSPVEIPEPPASEICLVDDEEPASPAVELIALGNGQREIAVEVGSHVELEWIVRNYGNVDLRDLEIEDSLAGSVIVGALAAGESKTVTASFTVPNAPVTLLGLSSVKGLDASLNGVGPISTAIRVSVREPFGRPAIRILSPPSSIDPRDPENPAPHRIAADEVSVSGVIHSARAIAEVSVNGVEAAVTGSGPEYEFVTTAPVPLSAGDNTLSATVTDALGAVAEDAIGVVRVSGSGLRVVKLVNGQRRARAAPGDTIDYSVRIVNDGPVDLAAVTVVDIGVGDVFPAERPFSLAVGAEKLIRYSHTIPGDAVTGYIENEVFVQAVGEDGSLVGPVSDRAEVWIGDLILEPDMILLGAATPAKPAERQLQVLRASDGADVSATATGTRYEVLALSPQMSAVIQLLSKAIKDEQGRPLEPRIPIATVEVDANGKLVATSEGVAFIRAVHRSEGSGDEELRSNVGFVIVGLAKLKSIGIAPRSVLSMAVQVGDHLSNIVERKLNERAKAPGDQFGASNPPMILAMGSVECGIDPLASAWLTGTGYAELMSVEFEFLNGSLPAVDVLTAGRELLETIPPVQVGPVPIPVGWLLGRLLNFGATQAVEFKVDSPAVATVTNSFPLPSGIVLGQRSGITRVKGTLDLEDFGFGPPKSDDFLVVVAPQIASTQVRLDPTRLAVGSEAPMHVFTKVSFGQADIEIPLPGSQDLASYVDLNLPDPVAAYLDELIPGGVEGAIAITPQRFEIIEDRPQDPGNELSLELSVGLDGNVLKLRDVLLGFRSPGFMNSLALENELIASVEDPGPFETPITVRGEGPGTTHLGVETCLPLLGRTTDGFPNPSAGMGATIIVDDGPIANGAAAQTPKNLPVTIRLSGTLSTPGNLTFSVESLPSNGSLGAVTSTGATTADVTYTPASDFVGSDSFTIVASSGALTSAPAGVQVSVNNQIPTAAGFSSARTPLDAPVSGVFAGDDLDADLLTISIVTPPSNGSITPDPLPAATQVGSQSSVAFSYQPNAGYSGGDSVTFEVSDGVDSARSSVIFFVNTPPVGSPQIISAPAPVPIPNLVPQGGALSFQVAAFDADADALTFAIDTPPSSCAVLSLGTPIHRGQRTLIDVTYSATQSCQAGVDSFRLVADDGLDPSPPFQIDVYVNAPPVARDDRLVVQEGQPQAIAVQASDSDDQPLVFEIPRSGSPRPAIAGALPEQTLPGSPPPNPSTLRFFYEPPVLPPPTQSALVIDRFEFVVSDGTETSAPGVIEIKVNRPPVALGDAATTDEEQPVVIDVLANDGDPDGDPTNLFILPVTRTQYAQITTDGNAITYTPEPGFRDAVDVFFYEVRDEDGGIARAEVRVRVDATNEDPDAQVDNYETDEDQPLFLDVLANDSDPDGDPLRVQSLTQPGLGVAQNVGGGIDYTPHRDVHGADVFSYTVTDDEGGTATVLVAVLIRPVNDDPVAVDDAVVTDEEQPVTVDVLGNDSDVDADSPVVDGFTSGGHGTVDRDGAGLRYTPARDFEGNDFFSYTIRDGNGGSATGRVDVVVRPVNDVPSARDDFADGVEGDRVTIPILDNDDDVDGALDPTSVVFVGGPTKGSLVLEASGAVVYTPNPGSSGADAFVYSVADLDGERSLPATVTLDVNARPVIAQGVTRSGICCLSISFDVAALASDVDGQVDRATVEIASAPANGTVARNATTGVVTYTPSFGFNGSDSFEVTVADDEGARSRPASLTAVVGVVVGGFPLLNELVPGQARVEIYNAGAIALDLSGWQVAGYGIGSDPARESYFGPVVGGNPTSLGFFHTGAYLVVDLSGLGSVSGVVRLLDDGGIERDAVDTSAACSGDGALVSLARRADGFSTGDDCLDFIRVEPATLGASN